MNPFLFTLSILISVQVRAQFNYKFDETKSDKDFQTFAYELKDIIEKRDTTRLFPILSDSIFESKDGCGYGSKSCFIEIMKFREQGDSCWFWQEADKLMLFGFINGRKNTPWKSLNLGEKTFQSPSFSHKTSFSNTFNLLFVHAQNVNIRKKPNVHSEIIQQISHDTLVYNSGLSIENIHWPKHEKHGQRDTDGYIWIQVQLPNQQFGYIAERFTSLWLYKEMTISKINGKWKIISFSHPSGC